MQFKKLFSTGLNPEKYDGIKKKIKKSMCVYLFTWMWVGKELYPNNFLSHILKPFFPEKNLDVNFFPDCEWLVCLR